MTEPIRDIPGIPQSIDPPTRNALNRLREAVQQLLGTRGDGLDAAVTVRNYSAGTGVAAPGPVGPAGPPGVDGGAVTPDLTPPPSVTGLTASAGLTQVIVQWTVASYTVGHGHGQTNIYAAKRAIGAPAATFSDAVRVYSAPDALTIATLPSELSTRWHIWAKFQSADGVESTAPAGGTNGVIVTTGVIGTTDLGPLIVEAGNLASGAVTATKVAAGALDATKFAASIEPITIIVGSTLPTVKSTNTIYLTGTGKLYRWVGTAYVSEVPAADITGTLADAQIAALAASKITGTLTNAQLAAIDAAKVTGQLSDSQLASISAAKLLGTITDSQLAAIAATKITGQITATQITDGAISTPKLAAGAVTASTIAAGAVVAGKIAAGSIVSGDIAANTITGANLAAGAVTAGKITAGAIVSGDIAAGTITGTNIAGGTITGAKIAAGTIQASNIAADTITANEIAANSITSNELQANSVVAGKVAAGAIGASEIAAGAITTSKLLVAPGYGGYVNSDALLLDPSAWTFEAVSGAAPAYYPNFDGGSGLVGLRNAWDKLSGGTAYIYGPKFPVAANKTYLVESSLYMAAANSATHYLGVAFFDSAGTRLEGSAYPTGWPGAGSFHYFGLVNGTQPAGFARYSILMGAGATAKIPLAAVTAQVLILGGFNNTSDRWSWGGAQVRESVTADLIVDGAIIANKLAANAIAVGTAAVQNGAIVNAMIGNAQIDDAKIANVAVGKLTAGTMQVGSYIQSTNYTSGGAGTGWRINADGTAELQAAYIRGQLTASQINGNGLTIRTAGGTLLVDAGAGAVPWSVVNGTGRPADNATVGATIGTNLGGTFTTGNIGVYMPTAVIGDAQIADLNADKITVGSLRGRSVQAGAYVSKGTCTSGPTFLTGTTLFVENTDDFPASGQFIVLGGTTGATACTYTSKTTKSFLGVSPTGPLGAHAAGDPVVPFTQSSLSISSTNQDLRMVGDVGGGTYGLVAQVGTTGYSNAAVAFFGNEGSGSSVGGVYGTTATGIGVEAHAQGAGTAFKANSTSGLSALLLGNSTYGHARLTPLAGRPSNRADGQIAMIYTTGGTTDARTATPRLMYTDGTNWLRVSGDTVFNG